MAKQAKQVQVSVNEAPLRVVVRGNRADGVRVRKVRNIDEAAYLAGGDGAIALELSKGLTEVFFAVYPPVGLLCRGGASKGWSIGADGTVSRVAA